MRVVGRLESPHRTPALSSAPPAQEPQASVPPLRSRNSSHGETEVVKVFSSGCQLVPRPAAGRSSFSVTEHPRVLILGLWGGAECVQPWNAVAPTCLPPACAGGGSVTGSGLPTVQGEESPPGLLRKLPLLPGPRLEGLSPTLFPCVRFVGPQTRWLKNPEVCSLAIRGG